MVIHNVVALVEAFLVTLISLVNDLGRIIACFGSDIFQNYLANDN